jgi:hypothetical protein
VRPARTPVPAAEPVTRARRLSVTEPLRPPRLARIVARVSSPDASLPPGPRKSFAGDPFTGRELSPEAAERITIAEALGIPWERLLDQEIDAERSLRRFLGEPEGELPMWRFLSALPGTALDSWRVREKLEAWIRDARLGHSPAALRALREALDEMCGKRDRGVSDRALALHLTLAHERVRELARVARAAEKSRGDRAARLAAILAKTGATEADALWALRRVESPDRTHAIDDAVRHAREEGFEIPRADSEFQAYVILRKRARRKPRVRRAASHRLAKPGARRASPTAVAS